MRPVIVLAGALVFSSCGSETPGVSGPGTPAAIALSPADISLALPGDTASVQATVTDGSGGELSGVTVTWTTGDSTVATVASGLVTAVRPGSAQVRAAVGSVTADLSVTVDPPPLLYVAVQTRNHVSLVDRSGNVERGTIATPAEPWGIGVAPDGETLWVSSVLEDNVTVVDIASHAVLATVPVGAAPVDIAFSPDGSRAFVVNANGDHLTVIDVGTFAVVDTVQTGPSTISVAAHPGGSDLYVVRSSGTVMVIDLGTLLPTDSILLSGIPREVAINDAGTYAYVTDLAGGDPNLRIIDHGTALQAGSVPMPGPSRALAITPDGDFAYVGDASSDRVLVVDLGIEAVVDTITVGLGPVAMAISPAGDRVYVGNQTGESVSVIDVTSNSTIATIPVGGWARGVAMPPGG